MVDAGAEARFPPSGSLLVLLNESSALLAFVAGLLEATELDFSFFKLFWATAGLSASAL